MTEKARILRQCGNKISRTELLAALAEECMELAHSALKYRRSLTQDNPTPVEEDKAWKDVKEEISDVMNILVSGYFVHPEATIEAICSEEKALRWMRRLDERATFYNGKRVIKNEVIDKKNEEEIKEETLNNDIEDTHICKNCANDISKYILRGVPKGYVYCKDSDKHFPETHSCIFFVPKKSIEIETISGD